MPVKFPLRTLIVGLRSKFRMRAKKSLGQHFLVDRCVRQRTIEAAALTPDDFVVEIGPGRGFLTSAIAKRVSKIVAIELDQELASVLADEFSENPAVDILAADAREIDFNLLVKEDMPYKVVANLPYYAASPIIRRFLESPRKPSALVVMLQREVAQTMAAPTGKMGFLSVATQLYGKPRIVFTVPATAFRPSPKVESAILRIDVYPEPALELDSTDNFFEVVKAGFSAPRKQMRNSLSRGLGIGRIESESLLTRAGIDFDRRPHTLSLTDWENLYLALRSVAA